MPQKLPPIAPPSRTENDSSGESAAFISAPVPLLPSCGIKPIRCRFSDISTFSAIQSSFSMLKVQEDVESTLRNTELPPSSIQQNRRPQNSKTTVSVALSHNSNLPESLPSLSALIHHLSTPLQPNAPKVETEASKRYLEHKDSSFPLASSCKYKVEGHCNRQDVSVQSSFEDSPVETSDGIISSSATARNSIKTTRNSDMLTDASRGPARVRTDRLKIRKKGDKAMETFTCLGTSDESKQQSKQVRISSPLGPPINTTRRPRPRLIKRSELVSRVRDDSSDSSARQIHYTRRYRWGTIETRRRSGQQSSTPSSFPLSKLVATTSPDRVEDRSTTSRILGSANSTKSRD